MIGSSVEKDKLRLSDVMLLVVPLALLAMARENGRLVNDAVRYALVFASMMLINLRLVTLSSARLKFSKPVLVAVATAVAAIQSLPISSLIK